MLLALREISDFKVTGAQLQKNLSVSNMSFKGEGCF